MFYDAVHCADWCSYIFFKFIRFQRLAEAERHVLENVRKGLVALNVAGCAPLFRTSTRSSRLSRGDTFKFVVLLVSDYGYGEGTDMSVRSRKTTRLLFLELS